MPVTTTWVSPAAGGVLDLATGAVLTETWCDGVASDLLRLGGLTGAVTQIGFGVGTTASPTTTATSYVDIPEMGTSLTTTGGDVLVFLFCTVQANNVGVETNIALQMDAAAEVGASLIGTPVANTPFSGVSITRFAAPSAASHTFKGRWLVSSGTATARSTMRAILAVELKR